MIKINKIDLNLFNLELASLILFIFFLPSFEAPKNIFLLLYLFLAFLRQIKLGAFKKIVASDVVYLTLIISIICTLFFSGFETLHRLKSISHSLTLFLFGLILSRSNYSEKELKRVFDVSIYGSIPPLIYTFYNFYISHELSRFELHSVGFVNHTAIYLCIIFGACFSKFLAFKRIEKKHVFLLCVLLFAIAATLSRAALFGVLVIITCITLINLNLERVKRYFIVPILLTISLIMNPGVIEKQINNQKDHIILSYREKVWNIGIEAFRWFPVFGVGLDNWPLITPDRLQASLESKGKAYIPNEYYFTSHAHNIYLTYLTERGLIGFSALILLMTFWSSVIIKTLRADFYFRNSFAKTIQGASLAAFITVFFVGLFNTTLHHEHGLLSIFYFSLNIIYLRLHSKQKNQLKLFN